LRIAFDDLEEGKDFLGFVELSEVKIETSGDVIDTGFMTGEPDSTPKERRPVRPRIERGLDSGMINEGFCSSRVATKPPT
jgi:hypothetical protein